MEIPAAMGQLEIYTPQYFRRICDLEESHWWHTGMREIAAALLRSQPGTEQCKVVLDAGCGTGSTAAWARELMGATAVVGVDLCLEAMQFCRSRPDQLSSQASVIQLPFRSESFDLLLCWDVLQHLPTNGGDLRALEEMYRVLRPGGMLMVRANSRLGMWQHGEAMDDDFQRYTLAEVVSRFQAAGFTVKRATYANALPAVYESLKRWGKVHFRRRQQNGRLYEGLGIRDTPSRNPGLNRLLRRVLKAEARYLSSPGRCLPFGHTTLCLGIRPATNRRREA